MSPGGTMLRVYDALKARVMAGDFPPGLRLDPGRLAIQLNASATPVRDALYQLCGEGLVDSAAQEGFRQPQITESAMRDRYEWSGDLLSLTLRAAARHGMRAVAEIGLPADYGEAVAQGFTRLALLSPNHEHRAAIASLIDRSSLYRRAEADCIAGARDHAQSLASAAAQGDVTAIRSAIERFHRTRTRAVPQLAARIRDYGQV